MLLFSSSYSFFVIFSLHICKIIFTVSLSRAYLLCIHTLNKTTLHHMYTSHSHSDGLSRACQDSDLAVALSLITQPRAPDIIHSTQELGVCVAGTADRHIRAKQASSWTQQHRRPFVCCMSCIIPCCRCASSVSQELDDVLKLTQTLARDSYPKSQWWKHITSRLEHTAICCRLSVRLKTQLYLVDNI